MNYAMTFGLVGVFMIVTGVFHGGGRHLLLTFAPGFAVGQRESPSRLGCTSSRGGGRLSRILRAKGRRGQADEVCPHASPLI